MITLEIESGPFSAPFRLRNTYNSMMQHVVGYVVGTGAAKMHHATIPHRLVGGITFYACIVPFRRQNFPSTREGYRHNADIMGAGYVLRLDLP